MHTLAASSTDLSAGPGFARGWLSRWLRLLLGLLCIWAFMFLLIPALDDLPGIRTIIGRNKELNIKATALFYSDIEETIDATNYMRNQARFQPGR